MVDDIGDLDEAQVQEPGSKRHKEGDAAGDLLEALLQIDAGRGGAGPTHGGAHSGT